MIVAFTSPVSTGASFMDWSFNWLLGESNYWHHKYNFIELVSNPLTNRNAHGHKANHPLLVDVEKFIEIANQKQKFNKTPLSFYPYSNATSDFETLINQLEKNNIKIIVIKQTKSYPYLYERKSLKGKTKEELVQKNWVGDRISLSKQKLREVVSLMIVNEENEINKKKEKMYGNISKKNIICINDHEWYKDPFKIMQKIFKDLKLPMASNRIKHYKKIAYDWHQIVHKNLINFHEKHLPLIIDAILQKKSLSLKEFNLDLIKEIIIMVNLFKYHKARLLLPTNNFPKNTKDIAKFLKF